MKCDIILAGVGGQGLLSVAAVIGEAARSLGLCLKQAEVHGMAQRGGVVQSHVRYSDRPVFSDLVREGCADLILSLEPMEALRYLEFLSPEGVLVTNSVPLVNIPEYPEVSSVLAEIEQLPRHRLIDAPAAAQEAGAIRSANMVMLGAGAAFLDLPEATLAQAIETVFSGKPEPVIEANLRAFRLGLSLSREEIGSSR